MQISFPGRGLGGSEEALKKS